MNSSSRILARTDESSFSSWSRDGASEGSMGIAAGLFMGDGPADEARAWAMLSGAWERGWNWGLNPENGEGPGPNENAGELAPESSPKLAGSNSDMDSSRTCRPAPSQSMAPGGTGEKARSSWRPMVLRTCMLAGRAGDEKVRLCNWGRRVDALYWGEALGRGDSNVLVKT